MSVNVILVNEDALCYSVQYSAQDGSTDIVWDGVEQLYNLGYMRSAEYNWYDENWCEDGLISLQFKGTLHLMSCAWGEYMQHQADADYLDSVAIDVCIKHLTTSADSYTMKSR